ncbi:ABC transporter ATP-binding protein [Pseudogracilibacillus auburnensis]|uniref:ABC transporter ATP-binding protein n=1 Tax=Pseudogracilibacillus auburnensis TaxID=1494959 RepID=UPI001A979CA5|nr:ABC transporter ATP-binding protein [Pseudogracilibacillus auburnensis]MBO1002892.1 ABC transporter ATP-binding protein [Pseudogracilibacillus auburnensis]
MTDSTEKRLMKYALKYKKGILIGIICLMIATALELAGPFIAKVIIDDHILGMEGTWQEVNGQEAKQTVEYKGRNFIREDRVPSKVEASNQITVIAIDKDYYVVEEKVPLEGARSVNDGIVTIGTEEPISIHGEKLSLNELFHFFKPEQKPIFILLGLYMLLLIIAGFFQYAQTYLLQKSSNQIVKKMRNDVFLHTQKIPIDYYVDQPAGKIVARITNDTEAIRELYERVLSIVITRIIYMAGILIAIYLLNPKIALICLLIIPIIYLIARVYKHYGSKYNLVIRKTNSEINGNINESIQGMSIIQAFQVEEKTKADFEHLNEGIYTHQKKLIKLNAFTSFNLVNVVRNIAFVAFIWYFGSFSLEPNSVISIGLLYALVDYLTRFFEPVTAIVNQFPLIEQARASGARMFKLMDVAGEEVNDVPVSRYEGNIKFNDVSFAYTGDEYVLKNITFEVNAGETAAFVGHTGSGKSSIMNLLFRFYDPQKGNITIDGSSTVDWSRQQVRGHMGIVLQDPFLFSGTIISNVTMNDPDITKETAIKALQAVGANEFIEKFPNGYDQKVTEGGSTFSLGERQLISFARALAFDPAILILDEATANIDTETEYIIQKALEVLKKGRTTLVIAHRLSTIQNADKIFVLESGRIKETGNHEELIRERGMYYQMYQMQKGNPERAG